MCPGSIRSTCTLHCGSEPLVPPEDLAAAVCPASPTDNASAIVTPAATQKIHEFRLVVFMRDLRGASRRWLVFMRAGRCAPSHEFLCYEFTLSFSDQEDHTVKPSITVNVFQGQGVVLFVCEETD